MFTIEAQPFENGAWHSLRLANLDQTRATVSRNHTKASHFYARSSVEALLCREMRVTDAEMAIPRSRLRAAECACTPVDLYQKPPRVVRCK